MRCSSTAGVPRQVEVDDAARGLLQVEAYAARVGGEQHARRRVVVEVDEVLGPASLRLLTGEERRAQAGGGQEVADRPVRELEHASPLTEHHDLAALVDRDRRDPLAQLDELGAGQARQHGLGGDPTASERRPDLVVVALGQAVAEDPLLGEQAHQAQELDLGQGPPSGRRRQPRDRRVEVVVGGALVGGQRDRDQGVATRWQLAQDLGPDPAQQARCQAHAQGVEVARADQLVAAIGPDRVPRSQAPARLEGGLVDPVEDRRQLAQAVLHRCPGQDQAPRRGQLLDVGRGLGGPSS
jgi:hypothetical protein